MQSDCFEKHGQVCGIPARPTNSTLGQEVVWRRDQMSGPARGGLTEHIVPITSLSSSDLQAMLGIFSRYYEEFTRFLFERDLREKDRVILLVDEKRQIQGFSTTKIIELPVNCGPGRAIFSGDTVVEQSHWGDQALARGFIRLAALIKAQRPDEPLYWFLIVKGHRTYRYLPIFFNRFYPARNCATSPHTHALLDRLAIDRFGDHYDRRTGIVHFPAPSPRLSQRVANIPRKDRNRPAVEFFLERNPGYRNGDELVCLAEISECNLKPYARRLFRQSAE